MCTIDVCDLLGSTRVLNSEIQIAMQAGHDRARKSANQVTWLSGCLVVIYAFLLSFQFRPSTLVWIYMSNRLIQLHKVTVVLGYTILKPIILLDTHFQKCPDIL